MANAHQMAMSAQAGNVFSPSAPINEQSLFAGRKTQFDRILDSIFQRGQHVVVFGERGVGKTSLANVLSQSLRANENLKIIAPKINCTAQDTYASIWRRLFAQIGENSTDRKIGFITEPSASWSAISDRLPADQEISADVVYGIFKYLAGKGFQTIAIIDEFDRLDTNGETSRLFSDTIKMLSDYPIATTIIIVGVGDNVIDLHLGHESVQRALIQIHMPRMADTELQEIITKGLTAMNMTMDEKVTESIVHLSKGLPHYTHLLAYYTIRKAIDEGVTAVTPHHLKLAISQAIDNSQHYIRTIYHKATTSPRKDNIYAQVLLACANATADDIGSFAPADVRTPLSEIMGKPYEIPAFVRHLNDFADSKRGPVLEKFGETRRFRYRFKDPLMQPFVIMKGYGDTEISMVTENPK